MGWQNIFISVIVLGIIFRLLFIAFGSMTAEDKVSKAGNWLAGLAIVTIAWAVLNTIFGEAGSLIKNSGRSTNNTPIIKGKTDQNDNSTTVPIVIDNNTED